MPIHAATNVIVDRLSIGPIIWNEPNLGPDLMVPNPCPQLPTRGACLRSPSEKTTCFPIPQVLAWHSMAAGVCLSACSGEIDAKEHLEAT